MHGDGSNLTRRRGDFNPLAGNLPGPLRKRELTFTDCSIGVRTTFITTKDSLADLAQQE